VDVDAGLRRMESCGSADDPFPDALSVCEIMAREEVSEVVELGSYALGNELLENLAAVARGFPGRVKYNLIIPGAAAQHHFEVPKSFVHVPVQQEKVGDRPLDRRQVGRKEVGAAQASLSLPGLPLKLVGRAHSNQVLWSVGFKL